MRPQSPEKPARRCARLSRGIRGGGGGGAKLERGGAGRGARGGAMPRMRRDSELIGEAVQMAYKAVDSGQGGPFGAVVCGPDGEVVVRTHNKVILQTDPTAHAPPLLQPLFGVLTW